MFSEPATGNTPDEQPGAMPEIFPSAPNGDPSTGHPAEHRPLLDLPLDVHAGVGQLRHRVAGRPPAARRAARHRPRPARGRAAGARAASRASRARAIRLGRSGALAVEASHSGATYTTRVQVGSPVSKLAIGHTLPAGSKVGEGEARRPDGEPDDPQTPTAGVEVTVATGAGTHTLVVTAA